MKRGIFLVACVALACGGSDRGSEQPVGRTLEEPVDFAFGALDGSVVTGEGTRGRATALLFVTTFDLPSQAAARRLGDTLRTRAPRFNAAAVVLESAENAPLVDVFQKSLGLDYPVALADAVELREVAAFANIDRVPTLVLLDREGRQVRRHFGLFEARELERWLVEAERP